MTHSLRAIRTMIQAHFSSWLSSSRTGVMLLSILLLCALEAARQQSLVPALEQPLHLGEYVYLLFSRNFSVVLSSTIFFVLVSELLANRPFQQAIMIRSSRTQWLLAQILHAAGISLGMMALCLVFLGGFSLFFASPMPGWSAEAGAENLPYAYLALFPDRLRAALSPLGAIAYAMLPLMLFWFSLTMILLFTGLLGRPGIGMLICAFVILSGYIGSYSLFLPIRFAMVESINPGFSHLEDYGRVMLGYAGLNGALIAGMFWMVRKAEQ